MKLFTRIDTNSVKQTLKIYRQELQSERTQLLLATIFIPLQHSINFVILPLLISFFTQSLITDPHNLTTPLWLIGGMITASALALIAGRIGFITIFNHEERMTTRLTERALRGLLAHSHAFFANHKVGSLAGDVNTFARSYLQLGDVVFLQASSLIVNFTASLVVIAFIAPVLLIPLLILTVAIVFDALRSYTRRSVLRNKRKELMSTLFGSIADTLGNQSLVRIFARQHHEIALAIKKRRAIEKIARKEINILQADSERRLSIMFIFQILTMLLCMWLISQSLLSIAAFVFTITYLSRISGSVFALGSIIRQTEQSFLDASKITEILTKAPEVVDLPNSKDLVASHGEIILSDISFSYQDNSASAAVFSKLNLVIPAGQSVGIVGKSGGGKSTLTHLLLRYMDLQSGTISIDGQNIAAVSQDSVRRAVSYVPQDPFLFHRTLRENIAYGKADATDEEIIEAARKAHAMEFIDELPEGLDTVVGERGIKLSGGQRQRIAIARAILKDAPILMLDEATSALDSESEKLIQSALSSLITHRTSLVVAHRLSTIAKLDRIIVLDHGKIVEDGTHSQLLKQKGAYAKLWSHQSGGFIEE